MSCSSRPGHPHASSSDMDAALQYAQALEVALDATGMEGTYHVDNLPVWGV